MTERKKMIDLLVRSEWFIDRLLRQRDLPFSPIQVTAKEFLKRLQDFLADVNRAIICDLCSTKEPLTNFHGYQLCDKCKRAAQRRLAQFAERVIETSDEEFERWLDET